MRVRIINLWATLKPLLTPDRFNLIIFLTVIYLRLVLPILRSFYRCFWTSINLNFRPHSSWSARLTSIHLNFRHRAFFIRLIYWNLWCTRKCLCLLSSPLILPAHTRVLTVTCPKGICFQLLPAVTISPLNPSKIASIHQLQPDSMLTFHSAMLSDALAIV